MLRSQICSLSLHVGDTLWVAAGLLLQSASKSLTGSRWLNVFVANLIWFANLACCFWLVVAAAQRVLHEKGWVAAFFFPGRGCCYARQLCCDLLMLHLASLLCPGFFQVNAAEAPKPTSDQRREQLSGSLLALLSVHPHTELQLRGMGV